MSKLVMKNQNSGFSRVRGTRGYLAPEWMMNLEIDAKADVYSYGIVLLELLSGKGALGFRLEEPQENDCNHLVQWARQKAKQRQGISEIVDPTLDGEYDIEKLKKFESVALLCVGEDRNTRPPMSRVVELLVGEDKSQSDEDRGDW
nr:TPA_asm: hypothetical protein HUJ06_006586 [Nelumbo nucifera]